MKNKILAGAILLLSITAVGNATPVDRPFDSTDKVGEVHLQGGDVGVYRHESAGGNTAVLVTIPGGVDFREFLASHMTTYHPGEQYTTPPEGVSYAHWFQTHMQEKHPIESSHH